MKRPLLYLRCALLLTGFSTGCLWAGSFWNVVTIGTDYWLPDNITFGFDGSRLYLNNLFIYQPGGSSAYNVSLHLNGQWAVCGAVVGGQLVADPYVSFVVDSTYIPEYEIQYDQYGCLLPYIDSWTQVGHLTWMPSTPAGWETKLLLGADFADNGAHTFIYENPLWRNEATGTIVRDHNWNYYYGYYDGHTCYVENHSFDLTYVPEPSTAGASLLAFGWFGILARRRKCG